MALNEAGHLTQLIENLRHAEEHCSAIAFHRADPRWTKVATLIHQVGAQVQVVAQQSAKQALTILGKEFKA